MHIGFFSALLCNCVVLPVSELLKRKGVGVIGVIECNFLQPTHNKQDFDDTDKYRCTITCIDFELPTFYNVPFKIAITVLSPNLFIYFLH